MKRQVTYRQYGEQNKTTTVLLHEFINMVLNQIQSKSKD